jgi:hypothetical protein
MARGRIISRTLGTSRRFADIARHAGKLAEFAQALYPMVVVHSDDHGRQHGDAFTVKHAIWPTSQRSEGDFDKAIIALDRAGLVHRYSVDGVIYLQVLNFEEHQQGLHKRRESKFPSATGTPRNAPENPGRTDTDTDTDSEKEQEPEGADRRDVMEGFDAFWSAYPRKVAKVEAVKAWQQAPPTEVERPLILAAIARQRLTPGWTKDGGEFIPHPATYLRKRRWEDQTAKVARVNGIEVQPRSGYDWTEECRAVHGGSCNNDRQRHFMQMKLDQAKYLEEEPA